MPDSQRRVVIVGGSIGGLFAGLALLRLGWDVQIHESAEELDGRGAGITTHNGVFEALDQLGFKSPRSIGLQINTRKAFDVSGSLLGTRDVPQLVTSWGRLHRLLLDAFPPERYHRNSTYSHHIDNESSKFVTVFFTTGESVDAALMVAADGIRSSVRKQLNVSVQPQYAGYVAWRGLIEEGQLSSEELGSIFPYFTFCLPAGEQLLTYPVAGEQHTLVPGQRRLNLVWYRPAELSSTLPRLLTDVNGENNLSSIAPGKIRQCVVDQMRVDASELLSPQHAALIKRIEQPFLQPIYDVLSDTLSYGRVALIGDAAFTARPHLGMGVTKVAQDALALAENLGEPVNGGFKSVRQALGQFQEQRLTPGRAIVERSRQLGLYLQPHLSTTKEKRLAKKHSSFDAVMRETATDEFL